ncbi:EthD family reductase [Chloroflexota bacterium]
MVKFLGILRLNKGFDPDETWELWQTSHVPWAKKVLSPELKQYSINRVVKTVGESDVYGFSEMLFDDVESCEKAFNRRFSTDLPERETISPWTVDRIIAEFKEIPLL